MVKGRSKSFKVNCAIRAVELTKHFGSVIALDHFSVQIEEGRFFGFLGPNGAGKTTFIKLLTGQLRPTSGQPVVLGYDVLQNPLEVKRRIGLVSDEPNLYEYLTPREFLRFVGRIYGLERAKIEQRSAELLALVSLTAKCDVICKELSHGMRKKLEVAAALIHDPKVLFLDEPFSGIDPVDSRAIKDVLRELTERGVTVFMSSHVLEIVERLCTEIAIIHHGRLVGQGSVAELRQRAMAGANSPLEDVFLTLIQAQPKEGKLWWEQ